MVNDVETLSADILDDDFVQVFRCIHILQRILGSLRVEIKYKFATAPSKLYLFYCLVLWIITTTSLMSYTFHCKVKQDSLIKGVYFKICNFVHYLLILVNAYINQFSQGDNYVNFYVKLQKIDRDLHMKNVNKRIAKKVSTWTAFNVGITLLWVVFYNIDVFDGFCPAATIILIPGVGNVIEMVFVIFVIYFISIRVEYINQVLKSMLDGQQTKEAYELQCVSSYITLNQSSEEKTWESVIRGMHVILCVISDFIELFQYTIFCYTCQLNIWYMIVIQSIIEMVKYESAVAFCPSFCIIILVPHTMTILMILCYLAEKLTVKLETSRKLCFLLSSHTDRQTRENAKRMLLLVEVKSDISIYDIYTLDIRLVVHLCAIAATYTIVLLQFAML